MIVIAYNAPSLSTPIVLTRQNIVDIFTGIITRWNDPALTARNPALADLPSGLLIQLVVRQPGSGTTNNFATALKSFDPSFPAEVSNSVDWAAVSGRSV